MCYLGLSILLLVGIVLRYSKHVLIRRIYLSIFLQLQSDRNSFSLGFNLSEHGIATLANTNNPTKYAIPILEKMICLRFRYKYDGSGFSFFSILQENRDGDSTEFRRIYLYENRQKWTEIQVNVENIKKVKKYGNSFFN